MICGLKCFHVYLLLFALNYQKKSKKNKISTTTTIRTIITTIITTTITITIAITTKFVFFLLLHHEEHLLSVLSASFRHFPSSST